MNTSQWPALVRNSAYNVYGWAGTLPQIYNGVTINGGIPQLGNLSLHLSKLARDLKSILPPNASGACLLDYEQWRADFNSTPFLYRNLSLVNAIAQAPSLNFTEALAAATVQFETAARVFLEASITLAKTLFPACRWGLYAYPINDWSFGGYTGPRAAAFRAANDNLAWLWQVSTALFPVVYLTSPSASKYDGQVTSAYVASTVSEAVRLRLQAASTLGGRGPAVFALSWYVYDAFPRPATGQMWQTLLPSDLTDVLGGAWGAGADAILVWGSVGEAPPYTAAQLSNYTDAVLGPAASNLMATIAACSAATCAGGGQCRANNSLPCFCPPPSVDGTCASLSSTQSTSGSPRPSTSTLLGPSQTASLFASQASTASQLSTTSATRSTSQSVSATYIVMSSATTSSSSASPSYASTISASNTTFGDASVGRVRDETTNVPLPIVITAVVFSVAVCLGVLFVLFVHCFRMKQRSRRRAPFQTSYIAVAPWPFRLKARL